MDERSGAKTYDRSGKGNHGTNNGITWTTRNRGSAIGFDGIDDYITCGAGLSLNVTGALTLSAWAKFTDFIIPRTLIFKGDDITTNRQFYLQGNYNTGDPLTAYKTLFLVSQSGSNYKCVRGATILVPATLYHLVGVFDPTLTGNDKVKVYVNGIDDSNSYVGIEDPTSIYSAPTHPVLIGQRRTSDCAPGQRMKGTMSEVRIYNRALTAAEVKRLYESEHLNPRW
jgi:hypothetical protein